MVITFLQRICTGEHFRRKVESLERTETQEEVLHNGATTLAKKITN